MPVALARLRTVVLDCPEPHKLAEFYQRVLGGEITVDEALTSSRDQVEAALA